MKIICAGGGPAGLYFAIAMKLRAPQHDVTVYELISADSAHGWGVTLGQDLLDELRSVDAKSGLEIEQSGHQWRDQVVNIRGQQDVYTGNDCYGIGRQRLVQILAARAAELGVRIHYGCDIRESASELASADVVVAADGAGSQLRHAAGTFGTNIQLGGNKYIWLATDAVFESFNFLFVETPAGWIWAYCYRFDETKSTFIAECSAQTWTRLGLDQLPLDGALVLLGQIFAQHLQGGRLIGQFPDGTYARWLSFRTITNQRWHHGNLVLAGDSAHTTHFTIGQGTKLALEDAIALAGHLDKATPVSLDSALLAYGAQRRSEIARIMSDARYSAQWFESLPRYVGLKADQFAALLHVRSSPLLVVLPPRVSYQVSQAAEQFPVLNRIRNKVGPSVKIMANRRSARRPLAQAADLLGSTSRYQ